MILISGWAGAGKDEIAKFFVTHAGFTRFAFADTLKDDVADVTGLPRSLFERPFKDQPIPPEVLSSLTEQQKQNEYLNALLEELQLVTPTPRNLLLLHAEKERAKDPDIYARKTVSNILKSETKRAVISDWRMIREGEFVEGELRGLKETTETKWKLLRIRVNRPRLPSPIPVIDHELDSFPSFDITISNEGTLEDLWESCNRLFANFLL